MSRISRIEARERKEYHTERAEYYTGVEKAIGRSELKTKVILVLSTALVLLTTILYFQLPAQEKQIGDNKNTYSLSTKKIVIGSITTTDLVTKMSEKHSKASEWMWLIVDGEIIRINKLSQKQRKNMYRLLSENKLTHHYDGKRTIWSQNS